MEQSNSDQHSVSPGAGDWTQDWLVGATGLHHSSDGEVWAPAGGEGYPVKDIIRVRDALLCSTLWGAWHVAAQSRRWRQLHDETLTEVLGIALNPAATPADGPGLVAVSPYGLAMSRAGEHGATRWNHHDSGQVLDERFSSAVLAHPTAPGQWIIGTEAGVLIFDGAETGAGTGTWLRTNLAGLPCRALIQARDMLWAATDGGGVWCSVDGSNWATAGTGLETASVFSLATAQGQLLAGTLHGICSGDGESPWHRSGPSLLVSAVAAHPEADGLWLAGATPGGLWRTEDAGRRWCQVGDFDTVHRIMAPTTAPSGARP